MSNTSKKITPIYSLIITTRNRFDDFSRLLNSLLGFSRIRPIQLIVIDQSEENCAEKQKIFIQKYFNADQYVYVNSPVCSLSDARNLALPHASGQYVCFPDDDCWYHDSLLENVEKCFEARKEISLLTGQYYLPNSCKRIFPQKPMKLNSLNLQKCASSVTIFIKRELISKYSLRFDERLGAGAELPEGEEMDFCLQALSHGASGYYDPNIYVYHQIDRTSNERTAQSSVYASLYLNSKHIKLGWPCARVIKIGIDLFLIRKYSGERSVTFWDYVGTIAAGIKASAR